MSSYGVNFLLHLAENGNFDETFCIVKRPELRERNISYKRPPQRTPDEILWLTFILLVGL